MTRTSLVFSCMLLTALATRGQTPVANEIVIRSAWSGYAIPPHRQIEIRIARDSNDNYSTSDNSRVETVAIENLVRAITDPVNPAPAMKDLGLTEDWLREQFPAVEKKNNELMSHENATARQKALFQRTFETPTGQVRVHIDQAGHHGHVAEIDDGIAWLGSR